MSTTTPDYIFEFITTFSIDVYNLCTIPDISGSRQTIIQQKVNDMFNILKLPYMKVKKMSSNIIYEDKVYSVNCTK